MNYLLIVNGKRDILGNLSHIEARKREITNHWQYAQVMGHRLYTDKPKPVFKVQPVKVAS